jgi:hypothetical protein
MYFKGWPYPSAVVELKYWHQGRGKRAHFQILACYVWLLNGPTCWQWYGFTLYVYWGEALFVSRCHAWLVDFYVGFPVVVWSLCDVTELRKQEMRKFAIPFGLTLLSWHWSF